MLRGGSDAIFQAPIEICSPAMKPFAKALHGHVCASGHAGTDGLSRAANQLEGHGKSREEVTERTPTPAIRDAILADLRFSQGWQALGMSDVLHRETTQLLCSLALVEGEDTILEAEHSEDGVGDIGS